MEFSRLEKSITDIIKEEQAKLGYKKEKIRLYYPLSSLNHFFQVEGDVTGMLEKLNWFPEYTQERMGNVEVTNDGERFCFHIPEEGVEYVHNHMEENEFIKELVELLQNHVTLVSMVGVIVIKKSINCSLISYFSLLQFCVTIEILENR